MFPPVRISATQGAALITNAIPARVSSHSYLIWRNGGAGQRVASKRVGRVINARVSSPTNSRRGVSLAHLKQFLMHGVSHVMHQGLGQARFDDGVVRRQTPGRHRASWSETPQKCDIRSRKKGWDVRESGDYRQPRALLWASSELRHPMTGSGIRARHKRQHPGWQSRPAYLCMYPLEAVRY